VDELRRFRLDGRVALVAGASGGIGRRASVALAGAGARVVLVGRSGETLADTLRLIEPDGGQALAVTGDMTVAADADRAVARAVERFGSVDILVNAIGGGAGQVLHTAEEYPAEDWDWIFELNLRTTVLNVSSVRGQLGIDAGYSAYVAAKGALDALTRQYATEWAKYRITVNAISPTFVRTEQVASMLADREFYDRLVSRIPLRRIADPDDLVGAILFFCSDASSFVTGQTLTLDGGLTATQ
jgi:NAD(P)-dependent dehydrogenase (short-subunit alcohol dehydrogenase family)